MVYEDRRIALLEGVYLVGRGIGCDIRFNAESVSRQHLRLTVRGAELVAENLSQTSGTLLNGQRLMGGQSLHHGDQLELGQRRFTIESSHAEVATSRPVAAPDYDDDEATIPGALETSPRLVAMAHADGIEFHHCPKCRTKVGFGDGLCGKCGYAWSAMHPSAVTSRVTMPGFSPAALPLPLPREVPIVYSSEELTIDALVVELTVDGAFVPSELLDPTATTCELTLLPDGVSALSITGIVSRVRARADLEGPAGMAVRFVAVSDGARAWIARWTAARR